MVPGLCRRDRKELDCLKERCVIRGYSETHNVLNAYYHHWAWKTKGSLCPVFSECSEPWVLLPSKVLRWITIDREPPSHPQRSKHIWQIVMYILISWILISCYFLIRYLKYFYIIMHLLSFITTVKIIVYLIV